jgi:tetratricopeptide (TPR) repeat protein
MRARKITLLVLLLLAVGAVFVLPRYVSEPWIAGEVKDKPATANAAPAYVSPSTAAEKTRYRQDSQSVLAQIIAIRDRLQDQHVDLWAEISFHLALQKIEDGDEQYSYGEYRVALDNYEQALSELTLLEELGRKKLETALTAGFEGVESLHVSLATAAGELAMAIAPNELDVQLLSARLKVLPRLAAQLEAGDRERAAGHLAEAEIVYQEAVSLDPRHQRAAASLTAVRKDIIESNFRLHMSHGFVALDNDDFVQAESAFRQAERVHPGNAAVEQALAHVETRKSRMLVTQQIGQAAELESREQWQQALNIYTALLEQDATLTEVKVKVISARVRAELDRRINDVLEDPLSLANPSVYRVAQATLNDARGILKPGEILRAQIAKLERALVAAVLPVQVVFQSDNLTKVTVFQVAELGWFEQTSLQLKPGRYVAAGTRKGFRDVRIEFTVTDEPLDGPIVVRCVESI